MRGTGIGTVDPSTSQEVDRVKAVTMRLPSEWRLMIVAVVGVAIVLMPLGGGLWSRRATCITRRGETILLTPMAFRGDVACDRDKPLPWRGDDPPDVFLEDGTDWLHGSGTLCFITPVPAPPESRFCFADSVVGSGGGEAGVYCMEGTRLSCCPPACSASACCLVTLRRLRLPLFRRPCCCSCCSWCCPRVLRSRDSIVAMISFRLCSSSYCFFAATMSWPFMTERFSA
mmetsp:Transcript_13381/g.34110  ORF Transcript_13381/g.34110 Transcript_13381/m.34110 type:complete len:229 (-) Transcript_13381:346-1032(-)